MDPNKVVDQVIDTVVWWYQVGKIEVIDEEAIGMALDEICPNLDWDGSDIISQVLMAMTQDEDKDILLLQGTVL